MNNIDLPKQISRTKEQMETVRFEISEAEAKASASTRELKRLSELLEYLEGLVK